jgi:hypothetical protein
MVRDEPRDEAQLQQDSDRITRRYGSLISRRPLPVAIDRGKNKRWYSKLVHVWRYGLYHPDEDLLGVVDAATDSLTTQIVAAEAVLTGSRRERLREIKQELNRELADDVPELAVLLGIEAKINALYPPAMQRRRAWMIRERFLRVASGRAADYWAAESVRTGLNEQHEDRIKRADESVTSAAAQAAAQSAASDQADGAVSAAQAAFDDAKAASGTPEEEIGGKLDRLAQLRGMEPGEEETEKSALEEEVGALLDLRNALERATADSATALAAKTRSEWALEAAKRERELTVARCDLENAEARLQGAERAARESEAGSGGTAGGQLAEAARAEVNAAQERADAARAALQQHVAAAPDGATESEEEQGAADPDPLGGEDGAASTSAAGASNIPEDADAQTLIGYIHSSYLMGIAREKAVRDLMRWLMMRFWTANLVLIAVLFVLWLMVRQVAPEFEDLAALVFGLFFIAAIGRVGATMSVVQRLQNAVATNVLGRDPILELTRLRTGKNGINLALFSGGVFALLIYVFFASGVPAMVGLDDGLAPQLAPSREAAAVASTAPSGPAPPIAPPQMPADSSGGTEAKPPSPGPQPTGAAVPSASESPIATNPANGARAAAIGPEKTTASATAVPAAAPSEAKPNLESPQATAARDREQRQAREDAQRQLAASRTGLFQRIRDFFAGPPDTSPKPPPKPQCHATDDCDPFSQFAGALGLADRSDFFKLLIWAFVGGFAERLVPDALDAIANRAARRRRRSNGEGEETA